MFEFIKKLKSNCGGFSVIELLVAIGIMALLMGIGAQGFLSYRRSQQVATVINEVHSLIKDARGKSMSVSNVDINEGWPIIFEVNWADSSQVVLRSLSIGVSQWSAWNGSVPAGGIWTEISIYENPVVDISTDSCDRVVFESVNGRMHIYNNNYAADLSGDREVSFDFETKNRILVLNSTEKKFDIL